MALILLNFAQVLDDLNVGSFLLSFFCFSSSV